MWGPWCVSLPVTVSHLQVVLLACLAAPGLRSLCVSVLRTVVCFHRERNASSWPAPVCLSPKAECVWKTHFSRTLICPLTPLFYICHMCLFLKCPTHRLNPVQPSELASLGVPFHLSSHLEMDFGHLGNHLPWSHLDRQGHHLTGLGTQHHPKLALHVSVTDSQVPPWAGCQ